MENNQLQKLPKLTRKRKGFVKDFVETDNATEAVVRNYNVKDRNVAKTVGSELLTFPNVIQAIELKRKSLKEALIEEGIDEKRIAEKVNVLLNAKDGELPDYTAIDKGIKHATTIFGVVEETPKNPSGNTYNFIFSPEVQRDVKQIEDRIKAQLIKPNVQTN